MQRELGTGGMVVLVQPARGARRPAPGSRPRRGVSLPGVVGRRSRTFRRPARRGLRRATVLV